MDQAVLQIVLEDIIAYGSNNDTHAEQTGCGNEQYPFLDAADRKADILFQAVCWFHEIPLVATRPLIVVNMDLLYHIFRKIVPFICSFMNISRVLVVKGG